MRRLQHIAAFNRELGKGRFGEYIKFDCPGCHQPITLDHSGLDDGDSCNCGKYDFKIEIWLDEKEKKS